MDVQLGRRDFLKAIGLTGASSIFAGCEEPFGLGDNSGKTDKPNIIFIIVDDMGYADLGCYGSKAIETPRLDKMAQEGMRFTQFYSGCTVCAPARSTLMTGTHMGHTPVRGNTGGISLGSNDTTVAEVLKKCGYVCGGFGKWGLGDLDTEGVPEQKAFDEFFGYYHQIHAHYYYPDYLIDTGKKVPLPGNKEFYKKYPKDIGGMPNRTGDQKHQFSHYLIFERMKKFIANNKNRPFFCYAPWTPPHARYEMPEDDPGWQAVKDKPWTANVKGHAAFTLMVDRNVAEVLSLLKELKIDDNTVVFFCSDNGASARHEGTLDSSGSLRGFKRSMYEGGLRVPMIAYWPGKINPAEVSDFKGYFPDVMPTLAELAGGMKYVPNELDGISFVRTLLGEPEKQKQHKFMYWEWPLYNWGKKEYIKNGLMQAVRMGDWKAVRHRLDKPFELYGLEKDIGETNDIAGKYAEVVEIIEAYIKKNRTEMRPQIEPEMPKGKMYR
jgi:arylsulfatase A-like enzyme